MTYLDVGDVHEVAAGDVRRVDGVLHGRVANLLGGSEGEERIQSHV